MKLGIVVFACLLVIFDPTRARAQPQSGAEIGLRTGYMLPMGEVADRGADLENVMSGGIPIWLELGVRASPKFMLGIFGQYAFGFNGNFCDRFGASCSVRDIRAGVQFHYHFTPERKSDPWLGLGTGYEWLTLDVSSSNEDASLTMSGFEYLNVQFGIDFKLDQALRAGVGPFMSFSLGEYSKISCNGDGAAECPSSIEETSMHNWLLLGARGSFVL
jgi:hypothetical protein